jgi:hypothetical protein
MVAVLDQRQHHVIARKARGQFDGVLPWHIFIAHALQDANRAAGFDHAAHQEMIASLLDQRACDWIPAGIIDGRPQPRAGLHDLAPHVGRHLLPHQLFGEIDRRRDQHQARERRPAMIARSRQVAGEQKREPASHGRANRNLRPLAAGAEDRDALLQPAADAAVGERPAGFAVTGIVEADHGAPVARGPSIKRLRLRALHVGLETAQPEQTRRSSRADPDRDRPGRRAGSHR